MADKKISALTSATTPLAGTEVLPIVQSGSTVKVAVNDMLGTISGTSPAVNSEGNIFLRATDALAAGVGTQIGLGGKYNASSYFPFGGISARKENSTNNNVAGYTDILTTTSGGTLTARMRFNSTGDGTLLNGNFVVGTAGKGITTGGATALGLGVNGSVSAVTIDTSNNLLVGAATSAGGATNTAKVVGGIFSTASGTASTTSGSAATMFTANGTDNEVYIVSAAVPAGAPALYVTSYLVTCGASTLSATAIQAASNISISVSGLNVQVTQISGASQNVVWTAIRVS